MTQEEFIQRTGIRPCDELWNEIHAVYRVWYGRSDLLQGL